MSFFGDLVASVFERRPWGGRPDVSDERPIKDLCHALLTSKGEISGRNLAHTILQRFEDMGHDEKQEFFEFLTHDLEIKPEEVSSTLEAYRSAPSRETYQAFATACEPPRQELIRRLNQVPGGTAKLVAMRSELLNFIRINKALEPLDVDMRHLFASWFNRGFLVLRRINWGSPADILDKIIDYEAVHAINSWHDLRLRLKPADRRCFGFFHPAMPHEPLIFVQVALTKGIPNSIQGLLADERDILDAAEADTAVFYSISNCQAGLANISFGNSLIKQVASDLARDLPNISTFTTLSPIPRLNDWRNRKTELNLSEQPNDAVAAYYLLEAKRSDGKPYDPVARFHLGNGAVVHAVHGNADTSKNGVAQSDGAMVNYVYDLSKVADNHEKFIGEKTILASKEVQALSASVKAKVSGELA